MPLLVLPARNRCELFFSRLLVKTVQFSQRFVEERFLTGLVSPILFVSKVLVGRHSIGEIFLRVLVHLDADFFSSINFELRFTKCGIVLEAIVNTFKTSLDASLSQIMGNKMFSLFFSFPITMAMKSPFLNDMVRD